MKTKHNEERRLGLAIVGLMLSGLPLAAIAQTAVPSAESLEKLAREAFGNSVRAQKAIQYIAEQLDLSIFGSAK